ncbi:LysR family transcriptional regulator [Rhizobium sp. Root73]|uniref:LysR family transcriptional regulator n=1 Tax=unclassified Rhizobium TaxID=2613769 RepID=UPI000728BF03|nr:MULTISPECIES: LysR family transcriptional regulator [unclassified Rhizobium]KQY08754.1 LysR family transcriptional regulator [Rhizobium sp. Root1334]KRC06523.1 LysR family transcriptional regulator [Rhizobium sp. Root73]
MAEISLTLIQTFYQVARHGSFSGAARELNLSYQSAANHVRRLEQILQAKLIESDQGAKRISLTPRGRTLYSLLHPELDIMLERLTKLIENQRSSLRVGMPQAIFFYLFPKVLARFREIFPEMEFTAYERDTVLAELVKNGSLDVCISERYFGDPVVPQRLLGSYRLSLVYPRAWGSPPDQQNIPRWAMDRPFITYEPGQTLRNLAVDFLGRDGAAVQPVISTSGSSSVKRCVEEGLGFSIIPSWCVGPEDSTIYSAKLTNLPEVRVYFGNAGFLQKHPMVQQLFDDCRRELVGPVLEPPRSDELAVP